MMLVSVSVGACELAHDAAVIHDGDTVAAADQLVIVGRIEQDRRALVGELAQQPVELLLGADIDAARRIVEQDDARLGHQPFGDDDLLLVAARQRRDRIARCADLDLQPRRCRDRSAARSLRAVDERPAWQTASSEAIARLSAIDIGSIRPSVLRSSGTSAMPTAAASPPPESWRRTSRPSTVTRPVDAAQHAEQREQQRCWPCPSRPPRPTISPAPTSSEMPVETVLPGRGSRAPAPAHAARAPALADIGWRCRGRSSAARSRRSMRAPLSKVSMWRPLRNTEARSASASISCMRCEM